MNTVWLLWFEEHRSEEDTKLLIGVYRTEETAKEAIGRLKLQSGFRDHPQGFKGYEQTLDTDSWTEGFM